MSEPFGINIEGSEYYHKVIEDPIPCLLLKKDLPVDVLADFANAFKMVDIKYEGEIYFALPLGFLIPPKPGERVAAKILDPHGNFIEAEKG